MEWMVHRYKLCFPSARLGTRAGRKGETQGPDTEVLAEAEGAGALSEESYMGT